MKLSNIFQPVNLLISAGLSMVGAVAFDALSPALAQQACVETNAGDIVCGTLVQENAGQNNVMSSQRVEKNGFRFELQGCVRGTGDTVNCDVLITNIGDQTNSWLNINGGTNHWSWETRSRSVSSSGDVFFVDAAQLGSNQRRNSIENTFVAGVPVRFRFIFDNMTSQTTQLSLLEIGFRFYNSNRRFHSSAQFRDVSIQSR